MVSRDGIVKTVVDVGSGKIKAIIGELSSNGETLKVLKYMEGPSQGMVKGEVRDGEALSKSILDVLEKLRAETGEPVDSISIGISGEKIRSRTVNAELNLDQEEEINEEHIQMLIKKAEEKVFFGDEQILKTEIYNIRVDNSGIVKNPIGVTGSKLQGDVHLIYCDKEMVAKLVETVNRIGVDVEKIILNPYASAKSTLGEEDMRMGVALADIGEGTTDIILYKNEKLIYIESIPLGGMHFKTDLMYMFKFDDDEYAKEILDKYRNGEISEDGKIHYGTDKEIAVEDLKNLIGARVDEIIEYIDGTIQKSGFNGYLGKGLVLTGGVIGDKLISVDELLDKINKKTGYVARRVLPPNIFSGLGNVDSSMATVIGLFYEVMEDEDRKIKTGSYTHQDIEVKNERKNQPQEDDLSKIIGEESVEEEKKEKKSGVFGAVKNWFSNFI
ncbi:Cell division protein FtsA [Fusobacterium sp. DD29]|uniref:cell division protein FtsA n=1 Tax=unclassified Fusobacterium TaxID=2648384 RepID=UPI001D8731B2|nr:MULTISPECIES: cell division protein FtsA [unclassified Fusobacterium]MBR8701881.1 Cell division protein FtsA [Fusobacterium sp. DD45]MBR8711667.1 Cell division protein FtsA [Fusobacterium sp. DD28]MBR8749785.1 Cell division protein FtsA [Fusobacterium sp. DD29]MBR8752211.1 Cell division protein FtsA [Fusobacterium sp. DD26]MBR8762027.1 Cell division protein FtsA [Fusobacterium sp. DD25]